MAQTTMNNPPKEFNSARLRKKTGVFFQYLFAILLTAFFIFPLYWMLISSFKTTEELLLSKPTFWPKTFNFDSYPYIFNSFPMWRFIFNSFFMTVCTTSLQLIIGVMAAYAFSKGDFPGKDILFVLILGALMIPIQVTFIPTYIMVAHWGWINTYIGLILPEAVSAYFIFMLRQNFKAVDESYLDAGRVDGMGRIGIIVHVLVPMCKPAIVTVTVIALINGWNSYFWPKMVTTSNDYRTLSIALREISSAFAGLEIMNFNKIMAAAVISVIPVVFLFLLCQRYILTGFSKAAMK
ncbi:MAG: carbohydrate ABC transporter permease [Clostridia bacterium]|nr:carbohydrate ABC transporter permease [Clostridia bacterium]MBR5383492.1 carbohydrate ABC transporter permease [Clostridia bacterium]